ncbi:MAG: MFS transporter [Candidatus Magasanikbacteria bacterium]|nr:MFS transporter [Candidatus Magasanikbacteria bacterium]
MSKNRNLYIIALIALVNMLGYGIIIPLLYSYSKKYGLSDFQNGLLFAIYSICQFISTPIIGRLSDKYGRRPMLIISIVGTALSFFLMAFAPNALFLFLARALDGLTAGNIPVAFAVISDSTKPEERAHAFGVIGSAFNFGFIFGPAIAALTVALNPAVPFVIAGLITILAAILTIVYLPETNTHMGEVEKSRLFDFKKLWHTLFDPGVGITFLISLIFFLAFSCSLIYGFQPFTMGILNVTESQNALLFMVFGVVGIIAQNFFVDRVSKKFGMKKSFSIGMLFTAISFIIIYFSRSLSIFVLAIVILALFNSIVQTLIPTILSQEADEKSQGSIMGLNASYQSIGMILGPLLGGVVATISIPATFLAGGLLIAICFFLSFRVLRPGLQKESAF